MDPGAEGRCLGLRQAYESGWTSSSGSDCLWESDRTWAECKERDDGGCVGAASEDLDLTRVRNHGSRLRVKADGLDVSLGVTCRSEAWYFGGWPCVQGLETNERIWVRPQTPFTRCSSFSYELRAAITEFSLVGFSPIKTVSLCLLPLS